ncbi:protein rep [Coleofasciculus sp. E1-EBD-02]|uniref:protein rep n=1 Tax=Coleofasciculus sp. E1-EBD-02 TaxID=3068481 RepID=UPI0032FECEE9
MDNLGALKRDSIRVAGFYSLSDREDFQQYAERILNCSGHFDFRLEPGQVDGRMFAHIQRASWCRCRWCPLCQYARISKFRARNFKGLTRLMADNPDLCWIFPTLTIRNCEIGDLRSQLRLMSAGYHRLVRTLSRRPWLRGYLRSLEVTRSELGLAHPHYHVLLLVSSDYFQNDQFLKTEDWVNLWRRSARLDYQPYTFVRKVFSRPHQLPIKALLEVIKYSVKPADLTDDADWLYELTDQFHRQRSLTVGGLVSNYVSQRQLDKIESEMKTGDEQNQDGLPCSLHWNYRREKYDFCWGALS